MFTTKCDMCGAIQTEEVAANLTGTAITMNGVTRHACGTCMTILRTAFAVGKEGMTEPMVALAKITEERDQLFRLKQANDEVRKGNILSFEEIAQGQKRYQISNPTERMAPGLEGPGPAARPEKTKPAGLLGRVFGGHKPPKKGDKRK
jgi:hypothetical protein